jgi:hypothetical protein
MSRSGLLAQTRAARACLRSLLPTTQIPNVRKPTDKLSRIDSRLNGAKAIFVPAAAAAFRRRRATKTPQIKTAGILARPFRITFYAMF